MKTTLLVLVLAIGALAYVLSQFHLTGLSPARQDVGGKPVQTELEAIAANGVVEGIHLEAALRLEVTGVIASIHVCEGQEVRRDTLLLELANDTQKHQVSVAQAESAIARAELERLRSGERPETRKASAAVEAARRTMLQQAEVDFQRSQRLFQKHAASREQFDTDRFKVLRAKAELCEAIAHHALVEAPARKEDIAAAEGRAAAAAARLRLAESDLAKTRLLALSAGRILQVNAELGELASPNSNQPLVTMADLSRLRVRAFIEELDAASVRVGQRALVTADSYPDQEFSGTIVRVLPRMGKRAPKTDEAKEYMDVYYREVLIGLDATSADLPINLRVQVRIDASCAGHPPESAAVRDNGESRRPDSPRIGSPVEKRRPPGSQG